MNLENFIIDSIYGERLLISKNADQTEINDNISSGLFGRHEDFTQGTLDECYVVHNSKAVVVKSDAFAFPDKETIKKLINDVIEKLRT